MRPRIALGALLTGTAAALPNQQGVLRGVKIVQRQQTGPVSPNTASDCTYSDTALEEFNSYANFQSAWELTSDNFFDYASSSCPLISSKRVTNIFTENPSIKDDCSGITIGNYYCVEVNLGIPRPTGPETGSTRTSTAMTKTTSAPTGTPKPSPTQAGLIFPCSRFYLAIADDNCNIIVAMYNSFSLDDFVQWNSAIGTTCSGIWAGTWHWVDIPGTSTAKPSITRVSTPLQTQTSAQSPGSTGLPCILKFFNGACSCVGTLAPILTKSHTR